MSWTTAPYNLGPAHIPAIYTPSQGGNQFDTLLHRPDFTDTPNWDTADLLTGHPMFSTSNSITSQHLSNALASGENNGLLTTLFELINQIISSIMGQGDSSIPTSLQQGGYTNASYTNQSPRPHASGPSPGFATNQDLPAADSRSNPRMQRLAEAAAENARNTNTRGWCLREVNDSMEACGYSVNREPHAYMQADDFANRSDFTEVEPPSDLSTLPAGAVVVWDRGNGHESGHISVALGDGREASDHIRPQFSQSEYGTQCRVFYPK